MYGRIAVFVTVLAVAAGCGERAGERSNEAPSQQEVTAMKSMNVVVMGLTAPQPIEFTGHCVYLVAGQEVRVELDGKGNISKAFRGDSIKHCEVQKTSDGGWVRLMITVDGQQAFKSPKVQSNEVIRYASATE